MSKQHYVVNCYTCQHNGQETCKGCNTLLVGDDEPYENWQLREDLESKDQKIADLEAKLAESENENKKIMDLYWNEIAGYEAEVKELKQQLAEKDELLRQKIGKMKSTDFIRMCKECGFMVQAKEVDNQTAIAELEKVKADAEKLFNLDECNLALASVLSKIDQQIKSLKGDTDV